ncbi:lipopolysaccharide assembly protein LapA domain-containing protein [Bdellovibrionota bacterium]
MRTILLLLVIIALLVVGITFGVQNSQTIEIRFFTLVSKPIPLWVVSYLAALFGALLALCGAMVAILKEKGEARRLRRQVKELEEERDVTRNLGVTHDIPETVPSEES